MKLFYSLGKRSLLNIFFSQRVKKNIHLFYEDPDNKDVNFSERSGMPRIPQMVRGIRGENNRGFSLIIWNFFPYITRDFPD